MTPHQLEVPATLVRKVRGGVSRQSDISFIKVQKVHRVIKVYVKNFKKELRELSDLLVSAGSRTLFDLVLVKFLQFSL